MNQLSVNLMALLIFFINFLYITSHVSDIKIIDMKVNILDIKIIDIKVNILNIEIIDIKINTSCIKITLAKQKDVNIGCKIS